MRVRIFAERLDDGGPAYYFGEIDTLNESLYDFIKGEIQTALELREKKLDIRFSFPVMTDEEVSNLPDVS